MSLAMENTGSGREEGPTEDDLFEVLSNRRRRYAVHALKQADEQMELGDVAEQVAAWEYGVERSELSYDERKRVYTALQQSHLPKMDDAGIVEYDKNRGTVDPAPALADLDVYMDVVRGNEIPWSVYYLGLSGVALALVVAVAVHAWPLTLVPATGWMAAVALALTVSATVHTYYARRSRIGTGDAPPELQ